NVREAPSAAGDPVGRLAAGAEAEVLEERGEWSRVRFPGGEGWVVTRSLQGVPEPPAEPVPMPTPAPVGSDAPSAKPASPPVPPAPPASAAADAAPPGGYLSQYTDDPGLPSFDTGPSVVSALSGLLLVLALIAGAVLLGRKLLGSRFPAARRPGGIRVLASRPVAPRQSLLLVEVEGLVWLVGQGPEGVQLIAPIEDERALERLDDRYEFRETPFQSELRRTFDREDDGPPASSDAAEAPAEPTREQRLAALRRRGKPGDDA
ncbi:MAG TPA: flagellar biosynthetic protein FliO, partial [Deferrisomatales bacterium]|nr:flagellar biosynthetic protein FliO [Deferrisomatales bacterium]